jgi:hypothetical protein
VRQSTMQKMLAQGNAVPSRQPTYMFNAELDSWGARRLLVCF